MKRDSLTRKISSWLDNSDYKVVSIEGIHSSVDILAQGKGGKFAIKVIHNIDSIGEQTINDLNKMATLFVAEPVIIGNISNNGHLERNMLYERSGARCMSYDTFRNMLSGLNPVIASKSVGAKIGISGVKLRYLRKLSNLSAGKLAEMLEVSKDTIYHHEKRGGYLARKTVEKAENIFGQKFRAEENVLLKYSMKYNLFTGIRMHSTRIVSAPFNIIAKKNNTYEISELKANSRTLAKRAEVLKDFANSFEGNYPFFIGESKSKSLHGLSIISKKKLQNVESESELLEHILEESSF